MDKPAQRQGDKPQRFSEILAIMDDQTWIWNLVTKQLGNLSLAHVRLPSEVPIRASWDRLGKAESIIIHWEAKNRGGGAIVEEIIDIQPDFDVGERIIILTTNPTHEDVVYFSELGCRKILRIRQREKELIVSSRELLALLTHNTKPQEDQEVTWKKLQSTIDQLPESADPELLLSIDVQLTRLKPTTPSARYYDAEAALMSARGEDSPAVATWMKALDCNPNYYRTYNNLIVHHKKRGRLKESFALMQKMHELNRSNVSRLVLMGEVQMGLGDDLKAEFYFDSALTRDSFSSGALNGLAEIRFKQGDLDASRKLLARSQLAYKTAYNLNLAGVAMVREGRFQEALSHYSKAQYVLPHQDKGPMLFYNIALCYFKWSKPNYAKEFVQIALIKDPSYQKAQKLLEQIKIKTGDSSSGGGHHQASN